MAEIEMDTDGNLVGAQMLTIEQYAELIGKSARVVKRALYGEDSYMIPGAVRDAEDRWRIPANAVRVKRPTGPRPEGPTNGLQLVPTGGVPAPEQAPTQQMVPWTPTELEVEPTLREALDDEPGFMSIATASEYLGIPEAQIRAQADRFQLENVGYNGSLRIPQRVVRRIMGV